MIETPIGCLPKFNDLKELFQSIINKEYAKELYAKQFSLYIDKIIGRIELQIEAYGKELNVPERLFEVLNEQKTGLLELRDRFGGIVTPGELEQVEQS